MNDLINSSQLENYVDGKYNYHDLLFMLKKYLEDTGKAPDFRVKFDWYGTTVIYKCSELEVEGVTKIGTYSMNDACKFDMKYISALEMAGSTYFKIHLSEPGKAEWKTAGTRSTVACFHTTLHQKTC